MAGHVFAKLCGYGRTLIPFAPYSIDRVDCHSDFLVRINSDNRIAVLDFTRSDFAPLLKNATKLSEVVEISAGYQDKKWIIETASFSTSWPHEFSIRSADKDWPLFELVGPANSTIWFQGCFPNDRVTPERMTAPGMQLCNLGETAHWQWYEFSYEHEQMSFQQRWYVKGFNSHKKLIITAQMPTTHSSVVIRAAEELAESFISKISEA